MSCAGDCIVNLSGVIPEAQEIVRQVTEVYLTHTRSWFIGLVAHGSAVKGGFIPGGSDINLRLYLEDGAFNSDKVLPLDFGLAIQRDLVAINLDPFNFVKCDVFLPRSPAHYISLIPGAYHLIAGHMPVIDANEEELQAMAHAGLEALLPLFPRSAHGLLGCGAGYLSRQVRSMCVDVWTTLYQILTLRSGAGLRIWRLPKEQAIALLAPETELSQAIWVFFEAVRAYYPQESSVNAALDVISCGAVFQQCAYTWWQRNRGKRRLK